MTSSRLFRISGLVLVAGAAAFGAHILARSALTAGADPAALYREGSWALTSALGVVGAVLVLLGLPATYARVAGPTGVFGLLGVVLIALAWLFLGLFLSLYGLLVAPWLADAAPALVAASAPLPAGIIVAFIGALVAELIGAVLLAIPFVRGRAQPRWVGYLLPGAALVTVAGTVAAPGGPASNLADNLRSNLGPVLLIVALGTLGSRMWSEHAPAEQAGPRMHPSPA